MAIGNSTLGSIFSDASKALNNILPGATPAAPPVTPDQAGNPPSMPGTRVDNLPMPADTLQIGRQQFGQNVRVGQIRELAPGIKPEEAFALTDRNGIDEIYFADETGRNFVAFVEKSTFQDVRAGYFGRFNDKRIKVLHVNDEANTFKEGFGGIWKWVQNVMHNSFGNEASKSINGLVTTAIGSFVAAAALKSTAPAAAAPTLGVGFLKGVGSAATNAVTGFIQTMASVVLFAVGAVGIASLIGGVLGHLKKGETTTLDMVTGRY